MTEYERADLDQVFFDRVHPVLPLIYRRRCHRWIDQPLPGTARACLRSAMRTIAAAMSAPGARFCDQLYAEPAWGPAEQQQQQQHKRRASAAAAEMVWLTRQIPHFSRFKVHPFLPDPLACAISFSNAERGASTATLPDADDVAHLVRVLKDLQGIRVPGLRVFPTLLQYNCIITLI
jgi:hypothetical protein